MIPPLGPLEMNLRIKTTPTLNFDLKHVLLLQVRISLRYLTVALHGLLSWGEVVAFGQ